MTCILKKNEFCGGASPFKEDGRVPLGEQPLSRQKPLLHGFPKIFIYQCPFRSSKVRNPYSRNEWPFLRSWNILFIISSRRNNYIFWMHSPIIFWIPHLRYNYRLIQSKKWWITSTVPSDSQKTICESDSPFFVVNQIYKTLQRESYSRTKLGGWDSQQDVNQIVSQAEGALLSW